MGAWRETPGPAVLGRAGGAAGDPQGPVSLLRMLEDSRITCSPHPGAEHLWVLGACTRREQEQGHHSLAQAVHSRWAASGWVFLVVLGSGAKQGFSARVCSGRKVGRKEPHEEEEALTAARVKAGLRKESPGPSMPRCWAVGERQQLNPPKYSPGPCPRVGQAPPRRSDIQALQSCSFPFCSHSPIFLFYLHCHLLALISSLAWGKLPKLDYRKVRARTPAAGGGSWRWLRRRCRAVPGRGGPTGLRGASRLRRVFLSPLDNLPPRFNPPCLGPTPIFCSAATDCSVCRSGLPGGSLLGRFVPQFP